MKLKIFLLCIFLPCDKISSFANYMCACTHKKFYILSNAFICIPSIFTKFKMITSPGVRISYPLDQTPSF
jgi:hypothetical protein